MDRTLSALYDQRDDAMSAVGDLVALGIPRDDITMVARSEPGEAAGGGGAYGAEHEEPGFWDAISNLFVSEDDKRIYEEGIGRGGATVIAKVDESQMDRAIDVMERHNPVDLDEREQASRESAEGLYRPGAVSGAASLGEPSGAVPVAAGVSEPAVPVEAVGEAVGMPEAERPEAETSAGVTGEEEVIPLAREELHVGKREVRGRVAVHTRVVEEPVSEDIALRDERVTVERTQVDRPAKELGEQAFQERIVETEERHEEPVVSKEARVTEELHVRKEKGEHVEHIEDTVRHVEADVEDQRTPPQRTR